jgi:GT2 family glycosyltransferase
MDGTVMITAHTNQDATAPCRHITVIIPTRNRPNDLRRCLASLAVVRYPHWDILVVDQSDDTLTQAVSADARGALPQLTYF